MNEQPSYYAILTAQVRYDNRLTLMQKIMYAEITALSNKNRYCYASNGYFAKLYDCSAQTISKSVTNLQRCGYVHVEVIRTKEGTTRKIYPLDPVITNNKGGSNQIPGGIVSNYQQNNTSNNIIDIQEIKQLIVRYFIDKVDGAYDVVPEASLYDNLKTIISKGYTVEQIKKLIDHKAAQFHRREIDTRAFRLSWLFKPVNFFEQYSIMEQPAQPKQRKQSGTNNGAKVTTDSKKWDDVKSL